MLLQDMLNLSRDNAIIAERVLKYIEDPIFETAAPILRFNYERAKTDPRPRVLVLGRWLHPRTSNKLVAGLNLNYLSDSEISQVTKYLPQIMKPDSLKVRWWTGYGLLPKIWLKAYRQYDERFVHGMGSADVAPEPEDYEAPKDPGQPSDQDQVSAPAAQEIQKLSKAVAQHKDEPPKKPEKKGLARLAKDTIKRIANLVRTKLFRNRKKDQAKQKAAEIEKPDELEQEVDELKKAELKGEVDELEQAEHEGEADELKKIEDEYETQENYQSDLDVLAEATIEPRKLIWKSPRNYVHWHTPEKLVEYQPKLRGCILDHATGPKLIAIYNLIEDTVILDLANNPQEVMAEAGWGWDETVSAVLGDDIQFECSMPNKDMSIEHFKRRDAWDIIREVERGLNPA